MRRKTSKFKYILLSALIIGLIFSLRKTKDLDIGKAEEAEIPNKVESSKGQPEKKEEPEDENGSKDLSGFSDILLNYKQAKAPLNIRQSPSTDSEIIGSILDKAYVKYYGSQGGWDKIQYQGIDGYAASPYLEFNDDENMFKILEGILIVNKKYGLPEDFDPKLDKETEAAFYEMKKGAEEDGIILNIGTAYRPYAEQKATYEKAVRKDGLETASTYSSRPGYSEHQAGLAIDVMGVSWYTRINPSFHDTEEAKWLAENAHNYGFILRYPEGKEDITGYMYESWHYRYVGKEWAKIIYESQLTLEEYFKLD